MSEQATTPADELAAALERLSLLLELGKVVHHYQSAELSAAFVKAVRS
jgi:hypothetical protein